MNPKSASALCWLALLVNLAGLCATAYSAQFFCSGLGALLVLPPALFARKRPQIIAGAVLLLSLALAAGGYGNFRQDPYRHRTPQQGARPN